MHEGRRGPGRGATARRGRTARVEGARVPVRALARAILARPDLWPTALRQLLRIASPGWWRRPPFLPWPDGRYLEFRFETHYGVAGVPRPADVVAYLAWCRAQERARQRRRRGGRR